MSSDDTNTQRGAPAQRRRVEAMLGVPHSKPTPLTFIIMADFAHVLTYGAVSNSLSPARSIAGCISNRRRYN